MLVADYGNRSCIYQPFTPLYLTPLDPQLILDSIIQTPHIALDLAHCQLDSVNLMVEILPLLRSFHLVRILRLLWYQCACTKWEGSDEHA